jgi:hypothetical protein
LSDKGFLPKNKGRRRKPPKKTDIISGAGASGVTVKSLTLARRFFDFDRLYCFLFWYGIRIFQFISRRSATDFLSRGSTVNVLFTVPSGGFGRSGGSLIAVIWYEIC